MNFIVTGGAGFIGSHLVHRLVSDGHNVIVIDNLVSGEVSNLSNILDDIRFEEADIRDQKKMDKLLSGVDGVFHQAALCSILESWKDPDLYHSVNVEGTRNILQIAGRHRTKVVYASSASVYGNAQNIPIVEDAKRNPINPYGKTKLDCEILAEEYMKEAQVIGLRYFNVFGARQNPHYAGVISKFLDRLMQGEPPVVFGDGLQVRDFVFVQDVVDANILAMSSMTGSGFFNVGGGKPTSVNDLAYMMVSLVGKNVNPLHDKPQPGDSRMSAADITKIKKVLGWRPKTSLEDGLRTLFQDFSRSS